MDRERIDHLALVQQVINRLGGNSFLVKGWSVTLVAGLFALAASGSNVAFVFVAYFPVFAFWALDGMYLEYERCYRSLYEAVLSDTGTVPPFSMDYRPTRTKADTWVNAVTSRTILIFHGTLAGTVAVVMILLMWVG